MIYKVYAKCVTRSKGQGIQKIHQSDLTNIFSELVDSYFEIHGLDFLPHNDDDEVNDDIFNRAYRAIYEIIEEMWEKDKSLECGDYSIEEVEDDADIPDRPNFCKNADMILSEKDILEKMGEI